MQNIIFAWRQGSRLSRFQSRHRCYSNQMWKLSSTNLVSFMKTSSLLDESLCQRRTLFSSSHDSLASISHLLLEQFIDFYHDQFAQIWCFAIFTLATRHVTSTSHSTLLDALSYDCSSLFETFAHDYLSSLAIFTHDRSLSLDALVTITHRFSTHLSRSLIIIRSIRRDHSSFLDALITITHRFSKHSSRSFIITRSIRHDRSSSLEILFDVIYERSTLTEVVKNKLIEARADFRKKYCHDFKR